MKNFSTSKLLNLIEKYSTRIPRYTSYPTAVDFKPDVKESEVLEAIELEFSSVNKKPIALYAHLPFCASLCYFCACNKIIPKNREGVAAYLKSLSSEIKKYSELIGGNVEVEQLHWGGGTPNFFTPRESEEVFDYFRKGFPTFGSDADISIEVDPRTLTFEHLKTYKSLGFNRISMGVQDFDADVQVAINRIQSFADTARICDEARSLGFNSINMDLLYGLPLQNKTTFIETISQVLKIKPERIALYGYAHVTWKQKVQKSLQRHDLPTPEERVSLFLIALEMLTDAGYEYIGLDHFALPTDELFLARQKGNLNRNFMGYSTHKNASVCGFGVSAVSTFSSLIYMNETVLEDYQNKVVNGAIAVAKGVRRNKADQLEAEVIEQILCHGRIIKSEIEKIWGIEFDLYFKQALSILDMMAEDEILVLKNNEILVTEIGRLFLRNIAAAFDSYLPKHLSGERPVFSQSL